MTPGVTWEITSPNEFETKHVAVLGKEEYDRRLIIANEKADGLTDWEEQMFMRPQFHSVAMGLNSKNFAKFETLTPDQICRVIYKLAGVG